MTDTNTQLGHMLVTVLFIRQRFWNHKRRRCSPFTAISWRVISRNWNGREFIKTAFSVELQCVFPHDEQGDDVASRSSTEYQELVEIFTAMVNGMKSK
jgi:hypothetical protein